MGYNPYVLAIKPLHFSWFWGPKAQRYWCEVRRSWEYLVYPFIGKLRCYPPQNENHPLDKR